MYFYLFPWTKEVFTSHVFTHFYSSSDLHCSRTILTSFISQVKKTTKAIPPPHPRKRCSKTPQINDVEKPQSMPSASSLPGALLCLSASAWVSIKPWCYSTIASLLLKVHKKCVRKRPLAGFPTHQDKKSFSHPRAQGRYLEFRTVRARWDFRKVFHSTTVLFILNVELAQ